MEANDLLGICRINDPVNSSTFGIVYRKACVLEFRYRKSTQNLDINRLHQIHLKPDAVSKHQRPYKLPPHKRDVLRHQLDELLSQGIIAPVNEKEYISSNIMCFEKINHSILYS
jgi:hypothetical protein